MGTLTEGGRLSTVDLLVLTSLDQLRLILKNTIYDFTKQAILFRRSIVLSLPLWLVFPARANKTFIVQVTLTIVTYDRQNIFVEQATDVFAKPSTLTTHPFIQ